MQSYSQDLRDRVLRALARGDRPTAIAARFEVSREWVYDVKNRFEKEGVRHRLPLGGAIVSRGWRIRNRSFVAGSRSARI